MKCRGAGQPEHVVAHGRVPAGQVAQLGDPVRVGQEADVHDVVRVQREAVLEAEGQDVDAQVRLVASGDRRCATSRARSCTLSSVVSITTSARSRIPASSRRSSRCRPGSALALEGVRAADRLEALDEHRVRGVQEEDPVGVARSRRSSSTSTRSRKNSPPRTSTTAASRCTPPGPDDSMPAIWRQQLRREVVDDVPAEVLQDGGRAAAPGPGHARDRPGARGARRAASAWRPRARGCPEGTVAGGGSSLMAPACQPRPDADRRRGDRRPDARAPAPERVGDAGPSPARSLTAAISSTRPHAASRNRSA